MPQPTELQFDGRLTNVSLQYQNEEYIGDRALPSTTVQKKTGVYKTYDKDERFTLPDNYVGPKSWPNEVEWSTSEDTYTCVDYGLEEFLSEDEESNADAPIQPQSDTTEFVTNLMMLSREVRKANAIFNTNNYDANNQTDIAAAWATLTSSTVVDDMEAGIDACFMRPNVLVMGIETWRAFSRSDQLLDVLTGTVNPRQASKEDVAAYFDLDEVLVGSARINTAGKGLTASYSRVWDGPNAGKGGAALLRVRSNMGIRDVVQMVEFEWKQRQTYTYQTARGARGGKMIRVVESTTIKSVVDDCGYLFVDPLVT